MENSRVEVIVLTVAPYFVVRYRLLGEKYLRCNVCAGHNVAHRNQNPDSMSIPTPLPVTYSKLKKSSHHDVCAPRKSSLLGQENVCAADKREDNWPFKSIE